MPRSITRSICGWGNFPTQRCRLFRPEKRSELADLVARPEAATRIARGLGRSYGDASLNDDQDVILTTHLNRMLDFDASTGTLTCEAGVSVADLIDTFLPRGWFPAVTPGTKLVTIGGAIAADVHGKNHHRDGSIAEFVDGFDLLTPGPDLLWCSRDQNPEVFWATIGGMGLTGVIQTARLRLRRVESAYLNVTYRPADHLDALLDHVDREDRERHYSVAWIDCLARGDSLGRGVVMAADHAPATDLTGRPGQSPLTIRPRRRRTVPCYLPAAVLNRFTVRAFNALYYRRHAAREALVDFESFFYPLDRIQHWNRIYGNRGFLQYQAVIPTPDTPPHTEADRPDKPPTDPPGFSGPPLPPKPADVPVAVEPAPPAAPQSPADARLGVKAMLDKIAASGRASFLAVGKRFGPANDGLLSFPIRGYTLALDLPNTHGVIDLLHELDRVVLDHGGRVYLAKDACTKRESFEAMYPRLDRFKQIKARLDPRGRLSSSLARRLGITEGG